MVHAFSKDRKISDLDLKSIRKIGNYIEDRKYNDIVNFINFDTIEKRSKYVMELVNQ